MSMPDLHPEAAPPLYNAAFVAALQRGVSRLVPAWGLSPRTRVRLLNLSENATFLADDPEAPAPLVLRVYRPGHRSLAQIASELDWIAALRADRVLRTPAPVPTRDGGRCAAFALDGRPIHVAAFAHMTGAEPPADAALVPHFRALGAISARLHDHARRWPLPDGFARPHWTFDTMVGRTPLWGDWRAAPGLTAEGRRLLDRLCGILRQRLAALGRGPAQCGLIHADLRLANLLVEGERIGVIDFDDCGFGWFAYDFAAAISFIEHEPIVPDLQDAWLQGYARQGRLPPGAEATLPALVMLRRLLLTAWIASHADAPTAQALGAGYTAGTVELAERFLAAG